MKYNHKYIPFFLPLIGFLFLISCRENEGNPISSGDKINFSGFVKESLGVNTRVPSDDSLRYVTYGEFPCNFYIEMDTEVDDTPVTSFGTYGVASGYEGRLEPNTDSTQLNWKSLRGGHTFYGWTFPSGGYLDYGENPFTGIDALTSTEKLPQGISIQFMDSAEGEDSYDVYNNNEIYETFIGTKMGPVNYVNNGTYVPLKFRHLVSKIYVDEIILDMYGSKQEHLKADMTIYGIPTTARFYPNPEAYTDFNDEENYNDGWPVVVPDPLNPNNRGEMTFYIENAAENQDYVWICPEVDFKDLEFSVSIKSTENSYDGMKEYSGTFENVVFQRAGENWDWANGNDDTVLHAGEMMVLRIILYPGGAGGLYVTILPWSTHDPEDTAHYSHAGLYSDASIAEVVSGQDIEEASNLYGSGENNSTFVLYENVTLSSSYDLIVPEGYDIQGNGHFINCGKNPINVLNVYNVYLTDGNGNFVYIDEVGNIYKVDPQTFEYDVDEPIGQLTPDSPSTINITNGSVS